MHFLVFILHFKHFWKKKIIIKQKNWRQFWRQFSVWRQFCFWHQCSKIPKNAIFGKIIKKDLKKWGGCPNEIDISKVMPKWKFWAVDVIFDVNFTQNLRNIEFSQAKRLFYLLELFFGTFWQNLRKILGTDFRKFPKL